MTHVICPNPGPTCRFQSAVLTVIVVIFSCALASFEVICGSLLLAVFELYMYLELSTKINIIL